MSLLRTSALLACLSLLTVATACGQPKSIASGPMFVQTKCADLIVFGLRGSGQSADKNDGVGQETLRTIENMTKRLHTKSHKTVRLEPILYDATRATSYAHYEAGVQDGVRLLGKKYSKAVASCPKSRYAIVGFSQGAEVVHRYAYDLTGARAKRLALIAMIADPRRNPADPITHWSYARKATTGTGKLGAGPEFGSAVRRAAIALCVAGDEVCNAPRGGASATVSHTHKHFYESFATASLTGKQLVKVLHRNGVD